MTPARAGQDEREALVTATNHGVAADKDRPAGAQTLVGRGDRGVASVERVRTSGGAMTSDFAPIDAEARYALERELADLRAQREKLAATLPGAEETGGAVDRADRLRRAMHLGPLDARIRQITARLHGAASAGPARTDVVGIGTIVTVRFADDQVQTVHIGEVAEELDPSLVTADSPFGRALIGHRAGDTVTYDTPEGRATTVVLSIHHPPTGPE